MHETSILKPVPSLCMTPIKQPQLKQLVTMSHASTLKNEHRTSHICCQQLHVMAYSIRCLLLQHILKNNLLLKDFATQQVTLRYNTESIPVLQKKKNYIRGQATGNGRGKIKGNGGYMPRS